MNKTAIKHREWDLHFDRLKQPLGTVPVAERIPKKHVDDEVVHVIEYSAYLELKETGKQIIIEDEKAKAALRTALERCLDNIGDQGFINEIRESLSENEPGEVVSDYSEYEKTLQSERDTWMKRYHEAVKDLETGFMKGAYARLKELQTTEWLYYEVVNERDEWKEGYDTAMARISNFEKGEVSRDEEIERLKAALEEIIVWNSGKPRTPAEIADEALK